MTADVGFSQAPQVSPEEWPNEDSNERRQWSDEIQEGFSLSDTFLVHFYDNLGTFIAASSSSDGPWLAQSDIASAHDALHAQPYQLVQEDLILNSNSAAADEQLLVSPACIAYGTTTVLAAGSGQSLLSYQQPCYSQPHMQSSNLINADSRYNYHFPAPHAVDVQSYGQNLPFQPLINQEYPQLANHGLDWQDLTQPEDPSGALTRVVGPNQPVLAVPEEDAPYLNLSPLSLPASTLNRSQSSQSAGLSEDSSNRGFNAAEPPSGPKGKKKKVGPTPQDLTEFVVVFENAPGALANVKRRRKLDPPVRKAAREVRRAGACHQCRFRKRTCSTGSPCTLCLKSSCGLAEIKCQRESPFVGKPMHEYFKYSSTRRVLDFDVKLPRGSVVDCPAETVVIDGVGRLSQPLQLQARRSAFGSFDFDGQSTIKLTEESKRGVASQHDPTTAVIIVEDNDYLGQALEQWALEYTSKFVHAAGPDFYSTTIAQILGTAYVKKGLPESDLVAAMIRVSSLSFILRAGVKSTSAGKQPPHRFRTVQAKVDTILYQRLQIAEKDFFQMLQHLIFRSAGRLNRDQVYPVALVLWQHLRICCIGASHLSNIVQRFQSNAFGQAEYQFFGLKLVLSTHMALFRSSNPLLLDMRDKLNQDLLGGDKQLIKLAMHMRQVVLNFREKGFQDMKGSIAYKKEYFDLFRKVYETK